MNAARDALATATARLTVLRASSTASFEITGLVSLFSSHDTGQLSVQGWALPVAGTVTDGFGPRPTLPLPGVSAFHSGTDIAAACGTPVHAATAGVVEVAGPNGTLGNWILLGHGSGVETGYGHLGATTILVRVGESVSAGQVIAAVGDTGASTGCHLHFEVRIDSTRIDPVPFLTQRGIVLGQG
nr:M23 family metallopeptidase [Leifsonia psychrotolerans]